MNIQFRKIHLPSLPEVNAHALMKLAGDDGNSGLQPPSLPAGVAKTKIVSRSNLDEIIQDIENGETKNITVLEWVHCLYNKDKWDAKNTGRSISTSEAIWKSAEQNSWLKQRLFWHLVLNYDGKEALASSLVKTYSAFSPQDRLDKEKLEIIQILVTSEPANDLVTLCRQKLLTPYQLFQKYQLPTKALILEQTLDNIVIEFSLIVTPDQKQVDWLLRCFDEMNKEQQVKAVESLLIQSNPKLGAKYPKLINWLRQYYGSSISNSRWNELSSEAKAAMRKWIGAVSYQDFQRLINLILDRVYLESWEKNRLEKRSQFWSNYSDLFERIRILLPQSSVNILGSYLNHQDVSVLLDDGSNTTEVCIFDFGNWFVIEFFRGDGSETSIIRKESAIEQLLFHSQLSVKRLRCLERNIHDHEFCWQYFCEQLLRIKNIFPNENIQYFQGLSYEHGKYNQQTGLPKPSSYDLQQRRYKVERWKQTMTILEREAKRYCN